MTDTIGEMGYQVYPGASVEETMEADRAALAQMQELAPNRFIARGAGERDDVIYQQCLEIGKKHGWTGGWDMTWLEEACQIDLDSVAAQIIGSCVATSHIMLLATRMLAEIVLYGQAEELLGKALSGRDSICPFGPFSYRAGRKYAGINGRGDGSTCSGQIRGTMALGFLPCDTAGLTSDYFPEPRNTSLYREWGASDASMSRWLTEAGKLDLLESVDVNSAQQGKDFIVNEQKPIQICSGWGFRSTGKRLSNGEYVYTRSGSWSHSMQNIAVCEIDGGEYVKTRNQWGKNAHSGKNYFWITMEEWDRWLRNANAMTIGEIKQRESKELA